MKKPTSCDSTQHSIRSRRATVARERRVRYLARKCRPLLGEEPESKALASPSRASYPLTTIATCPWEPRKLRKKTKKYIISVPFDFSMIDNPGAVMRCLTEFAIEARSNAIQEVHINHGNMNQCDLLAESLLDYLVKEYDREEGGIAFSGILPASTKLSSFIRGIGIIRELNIKERKLSKKNLENLEIFCHSGPRYREDPKAGSKTSSETTGAAFVAHINNCLGRARCELTEEAMVDLTNYTMEIIENILDHSGMDDWRISGYLDSDTKECEIAIFNFGHTIAQTFLQLDKQSFTWGQLEPYIELHRGKSKFTEEELATVFALQEGISSKNVDADSTRGQGTIALLRFFSEIAQDIESLSLCKSNCRMAILSGSTHIKFTDHNVFTQEEGRHLVPLNAGKTLLSPPEKEFVTKLKYSFPGTAIGIKFLLPKQKLEEVSHVEETKRD